MVIHGGGGEWETRSEPEGPGEPLVGAGLSGTIGRVIVFRDGPGHGARAFHRSQG